MPSPTPMDFQIETLADAEDQRDKLLERLKTSHPALKAIAECAYEEPCGLSACPLCGHRFREDVLPQLASLFKQPLDRLRFVTMYVHAVGEGRLGEVNPFTLRDSLRRIIARADIKGCGLVIGALEPEWRATERKWLLHLHVIASDVDKKVWDRIGAVLKKRASKELVEVTRSSARRVLRNAAVSDLADQLSYCIKFVTYDRLPRGDGAAKGKAVSLRGKPLEELVEWRSQYTPSDFLFLYGAKRLNGKFVRMLRSA